MDNCLLCLEEKTDGDYIQTESKQWSQLNILNIIEKYFWPIENLRPNAGICRFCWQQLYDFHIFHRNIEKAHQRNLELAKQRPQHPSSHQHVEACNGEYNIETENAMKIHLPFVVIPNHNLSNEINVKDELVKEFFSNEHNERQNNSVPTTNNTSNTVKVDNIIKKRGRPRKIPIITEMHLKKPKGKRGRPKKIVDNNEIIRKPKPGKRGRPRKKIVKKGKRGRPRKIQITEHTDSVINANDEKVPANLEQPPVQKPTTLLENVFITEQNTSKALEKDTKRKDFIYKKHMNKVKKRKRLQQHKALMRNYIATSVRCMSFIKK